MSQRSTKVRPCPFPASQPSALARLGAVGLPPGLAHWLGSGLRVQRGGADSGSSRDRAQRPGLLQPGSASPACDPSPWGT